MYDVLPTELCFVCDKYKNHLHKGFYGRGLKIRFFRCCHDCMERKGQKVEGWLALGIQFKECYAQHPGPVFNHFPGE